MMEALLLVGQLLKAVSKAIGIRGYIIIGLVLALGAQHAYYEGLPLIRNIPFVGSLPLVGDVAIGRVQSDVNAAVAGAQHAYAIASANAAAKAKADAEAKSQRDAAIVAGEFQKRLAAAQVSDTQSSKELDDALAEIRQLRAAQGIKIPPLDAGIADLLREHGFEVDE